jgi:hypothetical protein
VVVVELTPEQLRVLAGHGSHDSCPADRDRPGGRRHHPARFGCGRRQEDGGYGVALDPTVTPELRAEGLARDHQQGYSGREARSRSATGSWAVAGDDR